MFSSLSRAAIFGSACVLAIVAACGGIGIWSASNLTAALAESQRSASLLQNHLSADMMHDAIRGDVLASLLSSDPRYGMSVEAAKTDLAEHVENFNASIAREGELAATEDERTTLAALRAPLDAYAASAANIIDLAGRDPSSAVAALPSFFEQFGMLEEAMEHATGVIDANSAAAAERADQAARMATILLWGSVIIGVLAAIAIAFAARRFIVDPLLALSATMRKLAGGDNSVSIPGEGRADEIGDMAHAVVGFRDAAIEKLRLEANAEQQRLAADAEKARSEQERMSLLEGERAAEAQRRKELEAELLQREAQRREEDARQREEMEAERARNEAAKRAADEKQRAEVEAVLRAAADTQARVVEALAKGLDRLAAGDLTVALTDALPVEYEKLKQDFNSAAARLHDAVSGVAASTGSIDTDSNEIAASVDNLSRRTENQAASLEQTAAALEQITATVTKTAGSTREAANVVNVARTEASGSGEIVRRAIAAMEEIKQSSSQIAQIIGVIDEIAFQTNLLALNAAVEAARAGDAGRGFAVVAGEVRALAQRSAEAAKEIKALINTSTEHVGTGADLVGKTGESLLRIAERVAEIEQVVSEITASAQEQSAALGEVNVAINQMDQVTQQNAAMVEETAAASHSLMEKARELSALVERFQLRGKGQSQASAVRRAA
jgi:methyl-accepting chemotaxis protein